MMHQVVSSSEFLIAIHAMKRFLAAVYQHVRLQLIRVAEAGSAIPAGVRTLARVHPQMTTEIGHLDESPFAECAEIRFLAGVQSQVRLQMVVPSKSAKSIDLALLAELPIKL